MRRWHKLWLGWVLFAIVGDTIAYTVYGNDPTLSIFLRRTLYLQPNNRYTRFGRGFVTAFLTWLAIHLIYDVAPPLPPAVCADTWRARHEGPQAAGTGLPGV